MSQQQPRLAYQTLAPKSTQALVAFSQAAAPALEPRLRELVKLRVSQINGCAFCMDMHATALLKMDVDARTLHVLAGWREAQRFFSERERAALAWAEAVNAVPQRTPCDAEFEEARQHLSDEELAQLTFVVGAIRVWNMLNASFHMPVPAKPYTVE
jgi:AhpD family alkylhydroperoxidase